MPGNSGSPSGRRVIVMVWDGMRPDHISEDLTPHLAALAARGVRFSDSHAVFPTVTRCNSASIATGALPEGHGIPGNTIYAPAIEPARAVSVGEARYLEALRPARDGRVLYRPAMGDYIAAAGGRTVVVSTGSTGSALLQHPEARAAGDRLLHRELWIGTTQSELEARLGPLPPGSLPNTAQNAWFTRSITEIALSEWQPWLVQFWHTDPDRTQHERGIGHPETLQAIREADANLGAILTALDRLGLAASTDVIVTSDHGFSTITGRLDLKDELLRAGLMTAADSTDIVVTENFVYVPGGDAGRVAAVAAFLQTVPGMGAVFTGGGGLPVAPGTLPISALGIAGELAPEIVYSPDWSDAENEFGRPGTAWSGPYPKPATHGAISPWDVRNTLVAGGPSFKRGLVSEAPAGNIDIAPTVLHLLGLSTTEQMDGRVLREALVGGPDPSAVHVTRTRSWSESARGRQTLQVSEVDGARYIDWGMVERA